MWSWLSNQQHWECTVISILFQPLPLPSIWSIMPPSPLLSVIFSLLLSPILLFPFIALLSLFFPSTSLSFSYTSSSALYPFLSFSLFSHSPSSYLPCFLAVVFLMSLQNKRAGFESCFEGSCVLVWATRNREIFIRLFLQWGFVVFLYIYTKDI